MREVDWKEDYSALDKKDPDAEISPLPEKKDPPVQVVKKTELKKADIRILLAVREMLRKQAANAEQRKQAATIVEVEQSEYLLDVNSLESYITRVLSTSKEPVHINDIIVKCEQIGWNTEEVKHKFASVYKALKENYYMFTMVSPSCFAIRQGFVGDKPERSTSKEEVAYDPEVPTIVDVVASIVEKFQTENGIYPSRVHYIMKRMGYKCGYSSVYRAMQTDRFSRNGYWYCLNDLHNDTDKDKAGQQVGNKTT